MKTLVTGGAGFIGSNFARYLVTEHQDERVVVLDKLTYAGRVETIQDLIDGGKLELVEGDIADHDAVRTAIEGCDAIVNFAAESHVDRSIEEPGHFIQTDVYGTYVLLEESRRAGIDRYYSDKAFTMKVIAKYTKEKDPDIIDRTYEFYRRAGFRRELMISEPGVQGILDFLSETVPEAKKAVPAQFFDDRFVRQLNSVK